MKAKSILYIQHAQAVGGSVVSLKELIIDALASGYCCTVVCPNENIANIYKAIGAQTYVDTVVTFNHNTAFHYKLNVLNCLRMVKMVLRTFLSCVSFSAILKKVRPDIIHLNSSNLILYCIYFRMLKIPTVFHVREYIVTGSFGIRKSIIQKIANITTTYIIYISEFEFELLNTDRRKSIVIYNYIHENEFKKDITAVHTAEPNHIKFTLITLGGLFKLKGGDIILKSLESVGENVELLILGCEDPRTNKNQIAEVDGEGYVNKIIELLQNEMISSKVRFIGRVNNPAKYISQADALIFWAALPHFPRPVFEAWLLRRAVLYYNPLFKNDKIDGSNAFIVPEYSAKALGHSIMMIQSSNLFSHVSLNNAYNIAKLNFTECNFKKIDKVYHNVLDNCK